MAVNTSYVESTPTVLSSLSLNGSGATLSSGTIVASNLTVANLIFVQGSVSIIPSDKTTASLFVGSPSQFTAGNALAPGAYFGSENSLGFYRSAASVIGVSYGFLSAPGLISSVTTAQSASSAKVTQQGQIIFSILSLTTNGAALYYRSGNSVYGWPSSLAVG